MTVVNNLKMMMQTKANGQSTSCKTLYKPYTITDKYSAEVIPISAAVKFAKNMHVMKLSNEKFNYPLLECS